MKNKPKIPRKYPLSKPPKPCDESKIVQLWKPEEWDVNIPVKGFITDLVLTMRLVETPTKFTVWSALVGLSMLVGRDAYYRWAPDALFLNLYVWIIAPPRICPKSTSIHVLEKILRMVPDIIMDPVLSARKKLNSVHSKATPEHLYDRMVPGEITTQGKKIELGSKMSLVISELATFFGKQKYNEGLFSVLTNFYDCLKDDDEGTRGKGVNFMKDMYVTMFGATTPADLLDTIPQIAFGSGFMSRLNIIYQATGTRDYVHPSFPVGAPTMDELGQRLAWIAENAQGEYYLSKEAYVAFRNWYPKFKADLNTGKIGIGEARKDTNILKIATLIQISQYTRTKEISLESFNAAKTLVYDSVKDTADLLMGVGTSDFYKFILKMKEFLQDGQKTRKQILNKFQKEGMTIETLNQLVAHLAQAGDISIIDPKTKKERQTSHEERDEIIKLKVTKEVKK